jgi:hypothetical protein
MNDENEENFEKMFHDIIDNCTDYNEDSLVQFLLSDLEYIRQKFIQFQADIVENTVIGKQMKPIILEFANYCETFRAILQERYDELNDPERGKMWRKIILKQSFEIINKSHGK